MKKRTERRKLTDELRREYDLSKLKGVRGKYATRYQAGTNLVLLAPDVAEYFRDEQSVNTALRKLIQFCANSLAKRLRDEWPKPVLPLDTVCLRVPSPCGA